MTTLCGLGRHASSVALLIAFVSALPNSPATSQTFTHSTDAVVMVTPAKKSGASSVHYQASLNLACKGLECTGSFPAAPPNTHIRISRVSCYFPASPGSKFRSAEIRVAGLGTPSVEPKMRWWLPVASTSDNGISVINTGVGLELLAGQYLQATLAVIASTGHVIAGANCAVDGMQYQG
jgi:hypothetical protein